MDNAIGRGQLKSMVERGTMSNAALASIFTGSRALTGIMDELDEFDSGEAEELIRGIVSSIRPPNTNPELDQFTPAQQGEERSIRPNGR